MSDMILQMAKAHLVNVTNKRDQLVAQRKQLDEEIEKIENFLKEGMQEIELATKVVVPEPKYDSAEAERNAYAKRKDFS